MNDMDNKEAKDQASGKKDLFNEIETDLDLSFFDREKKRSKGDKDIRKTRRRASAGGGMGDHGRLIIVSAAVILAAVIALIFFLKGRAGEEGIGAEAQASIVSAPGTEEMTSDASASEEAEDSLLRSCDIPEISMLMDSYFSMRLAADAEGLYGIFGKAEDGAIESVREKLKAQASWIQAFNGIEVRLAKGLSDNSWVCFVTYSINFRRTDTDAPGIMYCYVEKGDDGSYHINDAPDADRINYMQSLIEEPEIQDLITETDNALSNVLGYDSDLALIYTSFINGEIYDETNIDMDREPEVNLFTDPMDSVLIETGTEETETAGSAEAEVSITEINVTEGNETGAEAE